eukprot:scaffold26449_cov21-Phaeocystis_antarctica.AAC.1
MRQQRDLGELHGTRERRPGAVCGSFRKTLFRPWESLSRIVVLGGGGECSETRGPQSSSTDRTHGFRFHDLAST